MCIEANIGIRDSIINTQTGEKLDWYKVDDLKDNAMLKVRPELFIQWDFEKNDMLEIDIWIVTKGTSKIKPWWYCEKCDDSYTANMSDKVIKNSGCPYCKGIKINSKNSLSALNPKLASEWHPTLNGELTPHDVTCGKGLEVWWLCDLGHKWKASINDRNRKNGCTYCANQKVWIGFNDVWTTNPKVSSLLLNPEDGYKYMQYSNEKVDWKCGNCNNIIREKTIETVSRRGLPCPTCSDGVSYSEKFLITLLKQLNIEYSYQKSFEWSNGKIYDFLLEYNGESIIVESHGAQHYIDRDRHWDTTLQEIQDNDRYKEQLARRNGIDRYIVIDARKSELQWIANNILNSELSNLFNFTNINWKDIDIKARKSIHIDFLELWNSGLTVREISEKTKYSISGIQNVLRKFSNAELCDYGVK